MLRPASAHSLILTDDSLLLYAIFLGLGSFFVALLSYNFVDIDLWHELALIRESLSAGRLLTADPYAYTPTIRPWIDHEWGAGAIAYFAIHWLGSGALLILKFSLALGCGYCCLRCARLGGADYRISGACAPLAIALSYLGFFTLIRAQAYSFFFTALLLLLLQMDDRGSRKWIIPWFAIFPIWLNVHGGFVVGLGLLSLHCLEAMLLRKSFRHLLLVLIAMCLEIFLNPYGRAYVGYLARALTMARPYSAEWNPVWELGSYRTIVFVVAVLIAFFVLASRGIRGLPGILPLSATLFEATLHRKLLPFFAIAWLCYIPPALQETAAGAWLLRFTHRRRNFWLAAWVMLACISVAGAVRHKFWQISVPQPIYPVGPVDYLAEQKFHGNILVPFRLGSYVSWKLFPNCKVSLDSRYEEVYPDNVVRDVFNFYDAQPDWHSTLTKDPTDLVLVPKDVPLQKKMRESNWPRIYVDQQFELYAKPGSAIPVVDRSSYSFVGVFP
ncbi:MAG: hypothetical protein DMG79_04130 [Acidobacteria bacterium]|nr:MAG: hypothetical protein DMG79_04130 [Acidobacteriota bacterium]